MKVSTTSQRLKFLLNSRGITQTELLEKCNRVCRGLGAKELGKSAISQYVSGKVEPRSDKIYIMAEALGVNQTWLLGYDEPMIRETTEAPDTQRTPTDADYEAIGAAARTRREPTTLATDTIISQLQTLERQLRAQTALTPREQRLIDDFRVLPKSAQDRVLSYIDGLFDRLNGGGRT